MNMSNERKNGNRILIAEDDSVSRRMLQAFLTKWGYEVISVGDGTEASKLLGGENSPTLAILDWMMPGMEGPEICKRVRGLADRPYTYILLLTARAQKEDLLRGLESGADDYLTKPFDAHELRARLHVGQRILDLQSRLIAAGEELRFQATHDPLTGIYNHGVVVESMNREAARQRREGGTFGIVLIDVDHFKRINDTYGHVAGDAVLRELAKRMTACVRPYDTVGRYGGEEFLIVAPSSTADGVLRLAERVREAADSVPFNTSGRPVHVTVSCGVSLGGKESSLDTETLLQTVDAALYRAKRNGRNRSELASSPESSEDGPSATGLDAKRAVLRR
jgi:two-component system, cell cycle response regulator